jgi:hypothetical protein
MIDREKVVNVLRKRFPGAAVEEVAAAANAIVGLGDEWEDVTALEPDLSSHLTHACGTTCYVADFSADDEFRLLRKRGGH